MLACVRGGQQDTRLWQVVGHDQIEPQIIRRLARRDFGSYGQTRCIDTEVDLGREVKGGSENDPGDRFPA